MATGTYDWLNRALEGTPVWNMGQLSVADKRVLDQAVRAGKLCRSRTKWGGLIGGSTRSVWYREDNPPWEVIADLYAAQRAA